MTDNLPLIAIVGPTASGKSSLAEKLALYFGSSVVSIDAMQVYRGMDIGTAKTPQNLRQVPLLMVDVADMTEPYSVSLFQRDARIHIDELLAHKMTPILCGGTGLYLNAVIDEMDFPSGETGGSVRLGYEKIADEQGAEALYQLLVARDPASARLIHPRNIRRVVRALEMSDQGISYAAQHAGLHTHTAHYDCLIFGIKRDRAKLHQRIKARVAQMFEAGLVDEVRALQKQGLGDALTSKQAIGYRQVLDYLEGRLSLAQAQEQIVIKTRQYAKRQISWFEHDGRVNWLDFERLTEDEAVHEIRTVYEKQVS